MICSLCGKKRRKKSFYVRENGKLRKECKWCIRKRSLKYYRTNPRKYDGRSTRWRRTIYGKYSSYKSHAKQRGLIFNLGLGYFNDLQNKKCYYCGANTCEDNIHMGIDRKDTKQGYTLANCVPCCWLCNKTKLDRNIEIFINHCKKITDYQNRRNNEDLK